MITCMDVKNCRDYFLCVSCPARIWLWTRIGWEGELNTRPDIIDNAIERFLAKEAYAIMKGISSVVEH